MQKGYVNVIVDVTDGARTVINGEVAGDERIKCSHDVPNVAVSSGDDRLRRVDA
jgi:hypothetical protein